MERKLVNGDYTPDGNGGLTVLSGTEELLQRALFRLTARRGAFPFLPELGSQLYRLPREKPSARQALAIQYAAQALEEETELTVTGAALKDRSDGLELTVFMNCSWQPLAASLVIGEGTDENS